MVTPREPIEFYQSSDWTCGPSCVIMIRSAFEETSLPRSEEYSIWRETITSPQYEYTTHPKLASYLMKHGYSAELWHEHPESFRWHPPIPKASFDDRMRFYQQYREQAEQQGMTTKVQPFNAKDIADVVSEPNTVAILFTSIGSTSIFHHRLAYGSEDGNVLIACPIEGKVRMSISELEKIMSIPHGKGALIVRRNL